MARGARNVSPLSGVAPTTLCSTIFMLSPGRTTFWRSWAIRWLGGCSTGLRRTRFRRWCGRQVRDTVLRQTTDVESDRSLPPVLHLKPPSRGVAKLPDGLNATTHAVFGVAALAGAALVTGADPPAYVYPAAVAASWLPDVDNPRSTLGNGLSRLKNPVLNLLTRPLSWALRTTSFVLVRTVGHRTMTHSLLGVLLFSLTVWLLLGSFPNLSLALVAGYASHVLADALNTWGVPLFWPLGKPVRLLPGGVRSGGAVEVAVALVALAFTLYALLLLYPGLRIAIGLQPI